MRKLVLWGHHVKEYQAMFALSDELNNSSVLEFGCGPSAVNATLASRGQVVASIDPLFKFELEPLRQDVLALFNSRAVQIKAKPAQFDVREYGGLDAFIAKRREGLELFFADFVAGRREQRYLPLTEGPLPFITGLFDYVLSSHFLFADADTQSITYHLETICELARVAHEVRIFPLIDSQGTPSLLLGPVLLGLQQANYGVEVREVSYSLYPQGNAMLRVWAKQCEV